MSFSIVHPLDAGAVAPDRELRDGLCGLASAVRAGPARDCVLIREELAQVRQLSGHAIIALQSSFSELDQLVRSQRDSLDALVTLGGSVDGARAQQINIATIVGEVGPLCHSLSELVSRVVGRGSEGARRADELTTDVGSTLGLLRQFEAVEMKTFVLGLNATIEAARAGEHGLAFSVVAKEVRTLAAFAKELNAKIGEELERAQLALGEVRESLVKSAESDAAGAHESKGRIEDLLRKLAALDTRLSIDLEEIRRVSRAVTECVALAVQALQFEDMLTQLLDCVSKRVDRLEASIRVLHSLDEAAAEPPSTFGSLLASRAKAIREHYRQPVSSPVSQTDVSSGSVEFF